MKTLIQEPLILFDGICNLCNSSVQLVIKYDTNIQFKFASLQSDVAKEILLHQKKENIQLNSILLINKGIVYEKSSAVLQICSILGGWFNLTKICYILPKSFRDFIYDYIAKNRYVWFGKKENCMVPKKDIRKRFLD